MALPLIMGGIGLAGGIAGAIGGSRAANRQFNDFSGHRQGIAGFNSFLDQLGSLDSDVQSMIGDFSNVNRGFDHFRRLASDAGPSRQDMLGMAASTGGSNAAALMGSRAQASQASGQAMQAFSAHRQGLDSLMAGLMGQRANLSAQRLGAVGQQGQLRAGMDHMKFQDFSARRQANTSLWNNISSMGMGLAGNALGNNMNQWNQQLFGNRGGQQGNTQPRLGQGFGPDALAYSQYDPTTA